MPSPAGIITMQPSPHQRAEVMTSIEETLEQRGKRYGKFTDHAQVTQDLKRVAANHLRSTGLLLAADQQEALDMIFHKIGRIVCGDPDYGDSWHDIAGYAKLVEDRLYADKALARKQ